MNKLISQAPVLANNFMQAARPKLNTFMKYAKVELVPPNPSEFGAVVAGFKQIVKSARTGAWKQQTVKQAWLNTLVATEVICWFFIGECIGKRAIVGYHI